MSQQPQPSPEHESSDESQKSKDAAALPNRSSPRWLVFLKPKVGIPLAIMIVLVSIPLGIRSWRLSSLPPIDEPFDVEAFCSVTIPDEENAFVEYREAFALFVADTATVEEWDSEDDLYRGRWKLAPTAFKAWISANARATEKWLEGTKKPDAMAVPRDQLSYSNIWHANKERAIARLAFMKAGRHLSRDETASAWKLYHAIFRFTRHLSQNASLQSRVWGIAIHAWTASEILSWAGHPGTSASDLEHAMAVLARDYETMTPPFSDTLKHEHLVLEDCLNSFDYGSQVFDKNPLLNRAMIFLQAEPEFSASLLDHVLKNQLQAVDNDLATRPAFVPGNQCLFDLAASPLRPASGAELANLTLPNTMIDLIAGIPRLKHLLAGRDNERCFQATMMAVLAVEHSVRLHGRFPESLNECAAPSSVKAFSDPHQPVYKPLIFSTDGHFAVVYSIGLDGIDDSHSPKPSAEEERESWSLLRNSGGRFEGFRIPLWRPESDADVDEAAVVVPDNVQD